MGFLALRVLTDRPEGASWLPPEDRDWLARTMNEERARRSATGHVSVWDSLSSGRVWLLCAVYFLNTTVTYGIFLWLPRILAEASGSSGFGLSTLTSIPFVAALIAMVVIGRHSDRTGERKKHVAACAGIAAIGLLLAVAFRHNVWLVVLSFTLSQMGQRSVMSVFWAIPPMVLGGTAAAAGIGLINAIGNLGGFFGPSIMGSLRDFTGGYTGGLLVLAAVLVVEALLVLSVRLPSQTVRPALGVTGVPAPVPRP
jgi:ACS family tartrate transporter-like MFS transporter